MTSTVRPIPWDLVAEAWPLLLPSIAIFAVFYVKNPAPPVPRLLGSMHGLFMVLAVVYSIIAGAFTWDPQLPREVSLGISLPFGILICASIASVFVSFFAFRGSRWYLALHVVTIPLILWIWLAGGTQISHISL